MHIAFNLLIFPNSMFTPLLLFFFIDRAMCSPEKYHLRITIIIIKLRIIGTWKISMIYKLVVYIAHKSSEV